VLLSDGVLLSDHTFASNTSSSAASTIAQSALLGDETQSMPIVPDTNPSN
jgi:hypothetical protein